MDFLISPTCQARRRSTARVAEPRSSFNRSSTPQKGALLCATEGHPCLTALRRPWLRADRRRLVLTSLSRQPATTLGCPRSPAAGHPGGAVSVVGSEAGHGRPASGRRFERCHGWRSEIKRAAPPGCRAAVERGMQLGRPRAADGESAGRQGKRNVSLCLNGAAVSGGPLHESQRKPMVTATDFGI